MDIERFQEEVREKQRGLNQKDAALFQKKLADDVAETNKKIREREKELRDIKKQKREALESEEAFVSFTIIWAMPILVCAAGLMNFLGNSRRKKLAVVKE